MSEALENFSPSSKKLSTKFAKVNTPMTDNEPITDK